MAYSLYAACHVVGTSVWRDAVLSMLSFSPTIAVGARNTYPECGTAWVFVGFGAFFILFFVSILATKSLAKLLSQVMLLYKQTSKHTLFSEATHSSIQLALWKVLRVNVSSFPA